MSQLRLNPLTGRWVTIVADRAERPTDFAPRTAQVEAEPGVEFREVDELADGGRLRIANRHGRLRPSGERTGEQQRPDELHGSSSMTTSLY